MCFFCPDQVKKKKNPVWLILNDQSAAKSDFSHVMLLKLRLQKCFQDEVSSLATIYLFGKKHAFFFFF